MARIPTFRDNFNDLLKFNLADLKRHGYLVGWCSQVLTWTRNGNKRGSIRISVNLDCFYPGNFVELEYTIHEKKMKYRIGLEQLPSNLGKGQVWYFICPLTGERCRTLYEIGNYFASRKAQKNTLYESQTYSKHYRWLDKTFGPAFKLDNAFDDLYKPYTKKHYRGKPTPKALKVLKWNQLNQTSEKQYPGGLDGYISI
ncbi:hypothetical protein GCM10027299_56290 [Larkinella ripae]